MSGKPCVLMLSASFYPHIGGTERQALELGKALLKDGWRVIAATRRVGGLPSRESVQEIEVHRLFAPSSGLVNSLCFLVSSFFFLMSRRGEYEVIHVHLASSPALAACLAGKLLGKRVVVKIGGGRGIGEIAVSRRSFSGRLKLRLLAWFKPQLVAVDSALLSEIKAGGLGGLPCAVVPNGVDCAAFAPVSDECKLALRTQLGILRRSPVFLFAGRLATEKQLSRFLEIWAKTECAAKAVFIIAGNGPLEKELRAQVEALGLYSNVMFAGARSDMPALYGAADVFVLPSISEGLSNAMLEAMSCGLAVMATAAGGASSVLEGGKAGILFDPLDNAAIAAALDRFMKEPGLCKMMGASARQIAAERYGIGRIAETMKQIYRGG
ncbi:MAG TPA: glycosyltransferase family 4 protein [Elusimicrobiales bacterium]|nr:glycosyltransferase family 4 protein [Elusimicrobiales bacterium]